jgi:hypothetical protein
MSSSTDRASDDLLERIMDDLEPFVVAVVERINVDEFTTVEFIAAMQLDEDVAAAYRRALDQWHEGDPELAKMVIHGQVIPQLLRRGGLVEWAGFAYGEHDPYAVPAWWRKRTAT